MKTHYWFLLLSLSVSACVSAGSVTEPHPEPPLENADQWQGVDCQKIKVVPRSEYLRHAQCVAAQLPPLDPNKREYFGEQYSPRKYLECKLKYDDRESSCDIYKLRRAENPEYWPNPDVPKPKWPDAPKESVYKFGMSSKDYFEALCKAEAGEFIYKTVENVEGVYQVRPRSPLDYHDYSQKDRYVLEDPYYRHIDLSGEREQTLLDFSFFETPVTYMTGTSFYSAISTRAPTEDSQKFVRYEGKNKVEIDHIKSRYGYMWRGISRQHDRELAIAGGEVMVVDLRTGEVLAVHRGFVRSGYVSNIPGGIFWLFGKHCPEDKPLELRQFLLKALKPINAR